MAIVVPECIGQITCGVRTYQPTQDLYWNPGPPLAPLPDATSPPSVPRPEYTGHVQKVFLLRGSSNSLNSTALGVYTNELVAAVGVVADRDAAILAPLFGNQVAGRGLLGMGTGMLWCKALLVEQTGDVSVQTPTRGYADLAPSSRSLRSLPYTYYCMLDPAITSGSSTRLAWRTIDSYLPSLPTYRNRFTWPTMHSKLPSLPTSGHG